MKIFISHSHADRGLVKAIEWISKELFANGIEFSYSSDDSPGGGIQPGQDWFNWIMNQVKTSDLTLVLLTSEAASKPWILWETGAVTGVALGSTQDENRVVPVLFRISSEQIPGPLRRTQSVYGESREGMKRLLHLFNQRLGERYPENVIATMLAQSFAGYEERIGQVLGERPLALTEQAVEEWVERLDEWKREDRASEVGHLHHALLLAFTRRDAKPDDQLLDVRLHRRLGGMYLDSKQPSKAADQFEKALKLAPKDLFLMHKLALARLEELNLPGAVEVLEKQILGLDAQVAKTNPEIAGLAGRIYRKRWEASKDLGDLRAARDAYATQLSASPSYYLADNVGQLSLLLGDRPAAQEAFGIARDLIQKLKERNYWAFASLATAEYALGNAEASRQALAQIAPLKPGPRDLDSIKGGLERLRDSLAIPVQEFNALLAALEASLPVER